MSFFRAIGNAVSARNRKRKLRLFEATMGPCRSDLLLDVGYTNRELRDSDNFLERHFANQQRIVALGIEAADIFADRYRGVRIVRYGGGTFPFRTRSFDICWSNAVIEHVGSRENQVAFFREIARVSRRAFVTTPNRAFPVEVHTLLPFVHWLPKRYCDLILTRLNRQWATGDYMCLMTARELRRVLAQAGIREYRLFRNRVLGVTLDFVVVFSTVLPELKQGSHIRPAEKRRFVPARPA